MQAKPGFALRHVVGEYMLMPTGENADTSQECILLNSVSAFLWDKLQSPVTREELLAAMLEKYSVDEATAAADLDQLLARFNDAGMLESR